jgi:GNAT superfamily N-acetyltransferase
VTVAGVVRHDFNREADLPTLLSLVSRARSSDPHAHLHPGGLQWLLRRLGREGFAVHRWMEGDVVAGFSVVDSSYVMLQPSDLSLRSYLRVLQATEAHHRELGEGSIEVSVWDGNRELLSRLEELGYEPSGTYGQELVHVSRGVAHRPRLPDGFSMRWLEPALDDAYVDLHRAAWSTRTPSTYNREMHSSVTSMPEFQRELVPIIAAPDGTLAAYCIAWLDPRTRTTEIEPLGTHPGFRRLGLARAITEEVVWRSAERGANSVMVWSIDKNPEARRVYESAGLVGRRMIREYRRKL